MKSIVLITTGQPSLNPRIVKEADALHKAGHEVLLLYCFWIPWALEPDTRMLKNVPWSYRLVGGQPYRNVIAYLLTRLRFKLCNYLSNILGNKYLLAERAQARCYDELLAAAKDIKADWYVGHNLGALAVAVKAAQYHGAKAGFDFEDHHRGEFGPTEKKALQRIIYLENKYVPSLNYFSASSPMITTAVNKEHPNYGGTVITLLNCFPFDQQPFFKAKAAGDNTLQLFWFSQTIGINRGLEILINALRIIDDPSIHLTLAGRCNDDMFQYIENNAGEMMDNIHFAGIIQPQRLPAFASTFDVGMALELQVPGNRDICLTNKLFTYLLAGNAIIFSETSMQVEFNKRYKVGDSFAINDLEGLCDRIRAYKNKEKLNAQKKHNYDLAITELNWEKESEKMLAIIR